jgi:hypothetical protein
MTKKRPRCTECRKGPGFRLDLVHVRSNDYRCPECGTRWRLVGIGRGPLKFRKHHVEVTR